MIERLQKFFFKLKFKKVNYFISENGMVELDFPNEWFLRFSDLTYDFFNEKILGALQLSILVNEGEYFDIQLESKRVEFEHSIIKIGVYDSIVYRLDFNDKNISTFFWITGYEKIKLIFTFSHSLDNSESKTEIDYKEITRILNTLKIN